VEHYSYSVYKRKETAVNFDEEKLGNRVSRMYLEEQLEYIFKMLGSVKGKNILDIGAGTGRVAIPLAKEGARVIASDASNEMLKIAREKARKNNVEVVFKLADAHKLPFTDLEFDAVVSIRTIMHTVNWKRALSEICRVSKKNVIIDFPPKSGFAFFAPLILGIKKKFIKDAQNYKVFSVGAVKKELLRNGFVISDIKKQYILPLFAHKTLNSVVFSRLIESFFRITGFTQLFGAPVTVYAKRLN